MRTRPVSLAPTSRSTGCPMLLLLTQHADERLACLVVLGSRSPGRYSEVVGDLLVTVAVDCLQYKNVAAPHR